MKYETNKSYGILGTEEKDIKDISFVDNVAVVNYNDGSKETLEFESDKDFLRSVYPELTDNEIAKEKGKTWHSLNPNNEKGKYVLAAAIVGGAAVLGAAGLGIAHAVKENNKDAEEETVIEQPIETPVEEETVNYVENIDLTNTTWEQLEEMINNKEINEVQGAFILKMQNFLNSANVSEDWENLTLTDEEVEDANKLLVELGKEELEGNEIRFGFTPEEVLALALRYNNYSNEEMAQILGGDEVDVDDIMNNKSNQAIKKLNIYLLHTDSYELKLDEIVNLTDAEVKYTDELNKMFVEYKKLLSEKKYTEAKEEMAKIEDTMSKIAYVSGLSDNYIELALNTYGAAASGMSVANGYKDLFTEEKMKSWILGNSEVDDVKRSIADEACGAQKENLESYNEYIYNKKLENSSAEAAYAAAKDIEADVDALNNTQTEYDKVTKNTVNIVDVVTIVDNKLMEEKKDEENMQYFESVSLAKKYIEMNETSYNSVTGGTVGQYIVIGADGNVTISDVIPVVTTVETKTVSEEEKQQKDEEVKKQYETDYQNLYEAAYQAFLNGGTFTNYDANDPEAAAIVAYAKQDAEAKKNSHNGEVTGGETTPVTIPDGVTEEGTGTSETTTETTEEVIDGRTEEEKEAAKALEEGSTETTTEQTSGPSLSEEMENSGITDGDDSYTWYFDGDIEVEEGSISNSL